MDDADFAWAIYSEKYEKNVIGYGGREDGMSVRPVCGGSEQIECITLNKTTIQLTIGESVSLSAIVQPSNTNKGVSWSSDNSKVAKVDAAGKVTAVGVGTAVITATVDGRSASCKVRVISASSGLENGYGWVDLGLPSGLKWASCNVGANAPEEYGDYFAWGETEPYYRK